MNRLVICLDPGRLLMPPCPVLFPEWGREFLVLAEGMNSSAWARFASMISSAECEGASIEVWQLFRADVDREDLTNRATRLGESAPAHLRARIRSASLDVFWVPDHSALPTGDGAFILTALNFASSGPAAPAEKLRVNASGVDLELQYLLPIGIRVLMNEASLCNLANRSHRHFRKVKVESNERALLDAEFEWAEGLANCRAALRIRRESLEEESCTEVLFDPELFSKLDAPFEKGVPTEHRLPFFQILGGDDRSLVNWFEREVDGLLKKVAAHEGALVNGVDEAIRRLAIAKPALAASRDQSETCVRQISKVRGQIKALESKGSTVSAEPRDMVKEWSAKFRAQVLQAARRRVTAKLFLSSLIAAGACIVAVGVFGTATPSASAWSWSEIVYPIGGGIGFIGAVGLGGAYWFWSLARAALRRASTALTELNERVRAQRESIVAQAREDLTRMTLMRNASILERARARQLGRIDRVESHIDFIDGWLEAFPGAGQGDSSRSTQVDAERRMEATEAYWWRAESVLPEIRIDGQMISNLGAEGVALVGRLAGAASIDVTLERS